MTYTPGLNGGRINATISGNTAGGGALVSTGTMTLAGGNNITLSQAGNAISIVGGGGVTNHSDLAGLTVGDNHTQYWNASRLARDLDYCYDSFDRANTTGPLGDLDIGGRTWSVVSGTDLGITSNSAYNPDGNYNINVFDAGSTAGVINLTVSDVSGEFWAVFRVVDNNNYFRLGKGAGGGAYVCQRIIGGSVDTSFDAQSGTFPTAVNGDELRIRLDATDGINFYVNGTWHWGGGDKLFIHNGYYVGLAMYGTVARVDDFSWTPGGMVVVPNLQNVTLAGNSTSAGAGYANVSSGTLTLAGGNNITLSQNGNAVTISGGAGGGGIALANSQTTYTSGTANLTVAGGAMTIASTTGQSFNFSVPQTSSLSATGAVSLSTNGSTISIGASPMSLAVSGAFTFGAPSTIQTNLASIHFANLIVSQTQNSITVQAPSLYAINVGVSGGNTTGVGNLMANNRMVFAGGNNITLSNASTGGGFFDITQAVTISGPDMLRAGISNIGNTVGTSGTASNQIIFAGGNNVTLSQSSTSNAAGQSSLTISVSAANQTVQTQNLHNVTLAGNSTSAGGGYIQISSGTLTLAGGNNITLSQNGNAVSISAFTQTVQTQSRFNLTVGGNSTSAGAGYIQISSGTMLLAGGNNVTLSQNGGSVTISAFTQTNQSIGLYALSNTTQSSSTTADARSLSFVGAGGVSVGATNGSVVISGGAGGGGDNTMGMSNLGNTSGTSGTISGGALQMLFAGGNNVTLSQSINGSSATISISAPNFATAAAPFAQQLAGNSTSAGAGYSTVTSGTMQWAGGNNITLSQNGASVTISGANTVAHTLDFYQNMDRGTSASLALGARTLMLQRINQENDAFAGNLTANTFLLNVTANMTATSLSSSHSVSVSLGLYQDNTTALSLVNSATTTWGVTANTGNTSNYHGPRWLSFVSSQWSSAPNFVAGSDYVLAIISSTSNYAPPVSIIGQSYMHSLQRSGSIGTSLATNTSMAQGNYWNAILSVTTGALPATIASNVVNRNNASAIFMPHIILNNRYSGTF